MVSCPADNRRDCDTTTSGGATDARPIEGALACAWIYPRRSYVRVRRLNRQVPKSTNHECRRAPAGLCKPGRAP